MNIGTLTINYYLSDCKNASTKIHDSETYPLNVNDSLTLATYYTYTKNGTTYYFYRKEENETTDTSNAVSRYPSKNNRTIDVYYGLRYSYATWLQKVKINGTDSYKSLPGKDPISKSFYKNWGQGDSYEWLGTPYYVSNSSRYEKYNYLGSEKKVNSNFTRTYSNSNDDKTRTVAALSDTNREDNLDYTRIGFYYEYEPSTKVIVRHILRTKDSSGKTTYSLIKCNSNAVYQESSTGDIKLVNNGFSQRKTKTKGSDKLLTLTDDEKDKLVTGAASSNIEFYEIDKSDRLIVSRSTTVMDSESYYYKCVGYNEKDISQTSEVKFPEYTDKLTTSETIQLTVDNYNGYVFIDYYYEKELYSTEPKTVEDSKSIGNTAYLKFYTKSANDYSKLGENYSVYESDNVCYVPSTEILKPYIETSICKIKELSYKIEVENIKKDGKVQSNIIYSVDTYKVWGVDTESNTCGKIENINNKKLNGKNISVNSMIGTTSDKVYNNEVGLYLKDKSAVKSNISKTYDLVKEKGAIFTGTVYTANKTVVNGILDKIEEKKLSESDYMDSQIYKINQSKYNGYRDSSGSMNYIEYTITSTSNINSTKNSNAKCYIYNSDSSKTKHAMPVNIYTPIAIDKDNVTVTNKNYVDHTTSDKISENFVIQQGTIFNLTVSTNNSSYGAPYSNIVATGKYVKYWYVKFNFDVKWNGNTYKAGQLLKIEASHTDKYATTVFSNIDTVANIADSGTTSDALIEHVKVYASSINIPDDSTYKTEEKIEGNKITSSAVDTERRIDNSKIELRAKGGYSANDDLTGMDGSAFYIVSKPRTSTSIGRIFDFEVTDCLDVNFKDVFRNLNESNTVNSSTGTRYYSGIRSLLVIDGNDNTSDINVLNDRGKIQYGSILSILPLGPYKHTSNSYIGGVKLGYRISFDVKTSGYYNKDNSDGITRTVSITPSYYYISKDGNTYNDNIVLYYKNSSGKYVKYDSSEYTIYYKPNDGYRTLASKAYTFDVASNDQDTLTDKLTGLKVSSTFELSDSKSMTTSANKFVQVWYGEYKLPNSTIALDNTTGSIDINNPLTDGYIGVKFDIKCTDSYKTTSGNKETIEISYNSNNKNATKKNNTSQWDYEGYLGFTKQNIGSALSGTLKLQLEKGVWKIDSDKMYNAIKGTVVLYDTDNRASEDYN